MELNNTINDKYKDIVFGKQAKEIANVRANDAPAGYSDCALKQYCGADPATNHSTQGEMHSNRATSLLCRKNNANIEYLISLIVERHNEVMPNMRFPLMADFIHNNLPFVTWTVFMAMEHIGHDVSNKRNIWIEPIDYARQLEDAIPTLAQWRKEVAVYNVPLYLILESIHPYVQKCISDWKNKFLPECEQLSLKSKCCGIFVTSQKPFNEINPII